MIHKLYMWFNSAVPFNCSALVIELPPSRHPISHQLLIQPLQGWKRPSHHSGIGGVITHRVAELGGGRWGGLVRLLLEGEVLKVAE